MKHLFKSIAAALTVLAFNLPAQVVPAKAFSVGSTAVSTTLAYAVVPGSGQGRAVVTFVSASADQAAAQTGAGTTVTGGVLRFYYLTNATPVTLASSGATNQIQVAAASPFTSNTVAVLRNIATDQYQRLVCTTNTQSTNVTFSANTLNPTSVGDVLYLCTLQSQIPVGSATVNLGGSGSPIWVANGAPSTPILIESAGAGTNVINVHVAGNYLAQ
jgi:hypothetical protein